jgi:hypothetical protein
MSGFPTSLDTCVFIFVIALGALIESESGSQSTQTSTLRLTSELGPEVDLEASTLLHAGCKMFYEVEQGDWQSVQCWLLMGSGSASLWPESMLTCQECSTQQGYMSMSIGLWCNVLPHS